MAKSYRENYENAKNAIQKEADNGKITPDDAEAILEFLDAKDPDSFNVVDRTDDTTKQPATLEQYAYALKLVARRIDTPLTEATTTDLNAFFSGLVNGTLDCIKDDGYAKGTVRQQQGITRKFYRYHESLGVEPEGIAMLKQQDTSVDERDIFDKSDVEALRNACDNSRDRCLLELLLYTGQRINAILTLRVKDVDPDEGVFWLNGDSDGLKNADQRGLKRPLLGAKAAVREWLKYHPTGEPDDYLITVKDKRGAHQTEFGDRLHYTSAKERLDIIGERAGIDKPSNAHNYRHYFATVAKRDYDLDSDTIKFLMGHAKDSTVMEATYAHLTSEDYIKNARAARGEIDPEDESPMTPPECMVCDEPLPDSAKACPRCGTVYTPDAKAAEDQIQEAVTESYKQVEPDDSETIEEIEAVEQAIDENMDQIMESEELMDQIADRVAEKIDDS